MTKIDYKKIESVWLKPLIYSFALTLMSLFSYSTVITENKVVENEFIIKWVLKNDTIPEKEVNSFKVKQGKEILEKQVNIYLENECQESLCEVFFDKNGQKAKVVRHYIKIPNNHIMNKEFSNRVFFENNNYKVIGFGEQKITTISKFDKLIKGGFIYLIIIFNVLHYYTERKANFNENINNQS